MSRNRARQHSTTIGLALAVALVQGLAATPGLAEVATITVNTRTVVFPIVTESDLDAGYVERDPARRIAPLTVVVEPLADDTGWTLYIRAEPSTSTFGTAEQPRGDVRWKFDHEVSADYRSLVDQEWVVLDRPAGGDAEVAIDVLVGVDWLTAPGRYRSSFSLIVRPR